MLKSNLIIAAVFFSFSISVLMLSSYTDVVKTFNRSSLPDRSVESITAENFDILIVRNSHSANLIKGSLFINGEYIGTAYERFDLRINVGKYPGYMRYVSGKGFVTGPMGRMGSEGDFYLEIGDVTWSDGRKRSNLMFHGGNKPKHSQGCVMLGAVHKDNKGERFLPEGHLLRELRKKFYGTEFPNSCPNLNVTVEIVEDF